MWRLESEQPKKILIGSKSTESELALLFQNLNTGGTKPGVLSVVPEYSDECVAKSARKEFPPPLRVVMSPAEEQLQGQNLKDDNDRFHEGPIVCHKCK